MIFKAPSNTSHAIFYESINHNFVHPIQDRPLHIWEMKVFLWQEIFLSLQNFSLLSSHQQYLYSSLGLLHLWLTSNLWRLIISCVMKHISLQIPEMGQGKQGPIIVQLGLITKSCRQMLALWGTKNAPESSAANSCGIMMTPTISHIIFKGLEKSLTENLWFKFLE